MSYIHFAHMEQTGKGNAFKFYKQPIRIKDLSAVIITLILLAVCFCSTNVFFIHLNLGTDRHRNGPITLTDKPCPKLAFGGQ